jgi:hypothetical protein
LILRTPRIEHRQSWAFFQRLLRIIRIDDAFWPGQMCKALVDLDITDFGKQRNALHYTTVSWFFDDLSACVIKPHFGEHTNDLSDGEALSDPDSDDFSIALALVIVRMGSQLLKDLVQYAPVLQPEWDLLEAWLTVVMFCPSRIWKKPPFGLA